MQKTDCRYRRAKDFSPLRMVVNTMFTLFFIIGVLLLISIGIVFYATRDKKLIFISSLILISLSLFLYYKLGNSQGLKNSILLQEFNNQKDVLPQLMSGLQKQLKQHPDDPITLVLLGKIYFTLGDYAQASKTFKKAYVLSPDDLEILVDYATADYLAKDGKFDPQLTALWEKMLDELPKDSELYDELTLTYEAAQK